MAAVVKPNFGDVMTRFGLDTYLDLNSDDLSDVGDDLVSDAEAETAQAVGEARYDGTAWTERQARSLIRAISYRTAAKTLENLVVRKAIGTHEPLDAEASDKVQALIESFINEAERLEGLVLIGADQSPFSLPAFGSSTYTPSTTDRTPLEKDTLMDERDNISSQDIDRG